MTYVIVISGQSNAQGCGMSGPTINTDRIKTWDPRTKSWGSSNRNEAPWTYETPDGNWGNNNIALGRAQYLIEQGIKNVYIIYDALGDTSINEWTKDYTLSPRYASLQAKINDALSSDELKGDMYVDEFIWSQGERDWDHTFKEHYDKLVQLFDVQLGNEQWYGRLATQLYMIGYHASYDKHAVPAAVAYYALANQYNCKYMPGRDWATIAKGDIHFSGDELWNIGYNRIAGALPKQI